MGSNPRSVVLTGDRPTGPLHLGHYVGSLRSRVELQERHEQFIMIADMQALTDHAATPGNIRDHISQVVSDYLAVGIDPEKSVIFRQSAIPAISELTMYYLNLVTWNRLKHNPTVKQEIVQKGFGERIPAGFMIYPVSQAADITAFKADLVPVGSDQVPMIEQTNEIVRAFNKTYKADVLVKAKALLPPVARLPGTDGKAKMGKSLGNAICLSDSIDTVAEKVKGMYTDPGHLRVEDPGKVEGNPVFSYLDAFGTDTEAVSDLKARYERGGLGDATVKKYLLEVLSAFLEPIRQRRTLHDPATLSEILAKGNVIANERASATLREVRAVMCLD
ncbi:MAG: tryptophan--tRNA ligase [Simkaniaceae bacterium]|nr:tryptophan--tRNA ligase [Simkaniaceae bacterium]